MPARQTALKHVAGNSPQTSHFGTIGWSISIFHLPFTAPYAVTFSPCQSLAYKKFHRTCNSSSRNALNAKDRVDARVLANASGCLADIGGSIDPGAQSVAALVEGTSDRDAVLTCLGASMQQLFPDEPAAYVE